MTFPCTPTDGAVWISRVRVRHARTVNMCHATGIRAIDFGLVSAITVSYACPVRLQWQRLPSAIAERPPTPSRSTTNARTDAESAEHVAGWFPIEPLAAQAWWGSAADPAVSRPASSSRR